MRLLLSLLLACLSFNSPVSAAVEIPRACQTQSVDCFVLNLGKDAYAFHWKGDRLYHKKKNVSSFKINGRVVSSSDSPVQSMALRWTLNNRVFNLSSELINVSINYSRDRLLKVNGEILGNLDYSFQKIETAAKFEVKKKEELKNKQRRENILKASFNRLNDDQKKQIQVILGNEGVYKSTIDGLWGKGTRTATKAFIRAYSLRDRLNEPTSRYEGDRIFQVILNLETDRAEAKRRAEAERKRKEAVALEKARIAEEKRKVRQKNIKLAKDDLKKKLEVEIKKLKLEVISNYGFRKLIPGATKLDVYKECGSNLIFWSSCYGIENIKFRASYNDYIVKSADFSGHTSVRNLILMRVLEVDLGPITNSWSLTSDDPNDGDILNTTRRALNKYNLDFEYTQRDVELYNEDEKDQLKVVYEGGKVALIIKKIKKDYSSENRLYIEYKDSERAKIYLEQNRPKRASASDF